MAKQLKCTFKPGIISMTVRSGGGLSYPVVGYILSKDERIFYLNADTPAQNGWYKLGDNRGWVNVSSTYLYMEQVTVDKPLKTRNNVTTPEKPIRFTAVKNTATTSRVATGGSSGVIQGVAEDSRITRKAKEDVYTPSGSHSEVLSNLKSAEKELNMMGGYNSIKELRRDMMEKFNRFKIAYPDDNIGKTFAHVFMTRPDLNLYTAEGSGRYTLFSDSESMTDLAKEPLYYYMDNNAQDVMLSLTRHASYSHDFNPYLYNKGKSFELSDEYIKTQEYGETFTGYKMVYGKNDIESKTAGTFSISYTDDNQFNVYKMHKIWIDYISKVFRGYFKADASYIRNRILDYAVSAYYFLCAEDGETILFWSKYYGVFPTSIPSSSLSWSAGTVVSTPDYHITYSYAWKDDFNPVALAEFNINGNTRDLTYEKSYNPNTLSAGKAFVGAPFVESVRTAGAYELKLRFRRG